MVGRRYTVGRARNCDLPIADDSVSRVHAELWFVDSDSLRIRDLGSQNGTRIIRQGREFVLGEETAVSGDQICFGEVKISASDVINALRSSAAAPAPSRTDDTPRPASPNPAAPGASSRASLVRCVCGAIKPRTGACPVCGE